MLFAEIDLKTGALGVFRHIVYSLDALIYGLIIDLYDIFRWICGARILENNLFNEISTRIGFILGLIMFFYISFDFVQIILDPDRLTDKDKSPLNIIKKFLIVIVLLGTSRYIFDLMFNFQNVLLANDDGNGSIIEKLLLPYKVNTTSFGRAISSNFFAQFYQITDDFTIYSDDNGSEENNSSNNNSEESNSSNSEEELEEKVYVAYLDDPYSYDLCKKYAEMLPNAIAFSKSFSLGEECLNARFRLTKDSGKQVRFLIDFNYLSLPVGILVAWMLIVYCVSVGIRVIQLTLLQVISPAAIVCYLSPNKENTFTKWLKLYFATYVDVFIRIAIIDFVIFLSGLILDSNFNESFWTSSPAPYPASNFWITVFMIMALLSFAKKAPDLIKNLLPGNLSSGIGFGINAKDYAGIGMVTGAAGTAAGMAVGGVVNAGVGAVDRAIMAKKLGKNALLAGLSGVGGGLTRGFRQGLQNKGNFMKNIPAGFKAQHEADVKYEELIASGGSASGVLGSRVSEFFGETKGQFYQRTLANADQMDKFKSDMHAAADEIKEVQYLKNASKEVSQLPGESDEAFKERLRINASNYRAARAAAEKLATGAGDGEYYTEVMRKDENGGYVTDDSGNFIIDRVKHTVNIASDDDDARWAEAIRTVVAQADAYSTSHNVELYNSKTGNYEKVGEIKSSVDIGAASDLANETRSYINSRKDFPGSQANDAAAGVKDRAGRK